MEPKPSDTLLLAARTAVLVMQAVVSAPTAPGRTILLGPSLRSPQELGTAAELAAALAQLPKPQSCSPELQDGLLVARCAPLPLGGAEALRWACDQWFARGIDRWLMEDIESSPGAEQEPSPGPTTRRALLVASGERLLLPFEAVEAYFRGYVIEGPRGYRLDTRSPDETERQLGATVVLDFTPTQDPPANVRIVAYPK